MDKNIQEQISVIDVYERAVKDWNDFYNEARDAHSVMDGIDVLAELRQKYPNEYWLGKDQFIKIQLEKYFV